MANKLDSITKRRKLKPRSYPYWERISKGRFIGLYRTEDSGVWRARMGKAGKYVFESLGGELDSEYADMLKVAQKWFKGAQAVEKVHYTVSDAVEDYIEKLKVENSEDSAYRIKQTLEKHLTPNLGKVELAKLTTPQLKRFRDGMVKKSDDAETVRKSKDSTNRRMSYTKAVFNLAFRDGMVESDAAWRRVPQFKGVTGTRKLFLTDKQVKKLLEKTKGSFHKIIRAAILTGARYGELAAARVHDLDLKNGSIHLDGKTGPRDCYLSDEALKYFKKMAKNKLPKAFLLVKDDGSLWGRAHQTRPWKAARKAAKLPHDAVFYSLRHYHISKALLSGVQVQVIAENCGTSIRMIEKHYGKFMAADRRAMMNMVDLAHE